MDYMDSVKIDLCEHWKFHLGEKEEAWYKGFDDSGWEEVTLPMTGRWGCLFQKAIPAVRDICRAESAGTG